MDENRETIEKLYLVRETKSGDLDNLREKEKQKIACAKKHFNEAVFDEYDKSNYKEVNVPDEVVDVQEVVDF